MRTAKQLANLRPPVKKGEIRNPKGKPKGTLNAKTILNKYLAQKLGKSKIRAGEELSLNMIKTALDKKEDTRDRIKATEVIWDRTDGKAIQPIAAVSGAEIHLSVSNLEKNDL